MFGQLMQLLGKGVTRIVDHFYPYFERWLPLQVYRYAVCGGSNMVFDWVLYFVLYNYVIGHQLVYIAIDGVAEVCISPHILAFCIVFPITLLTGFWLNKYVTFTVSSLRTRTQMTRYISIVIINLMINYWGLKLCVDILHWYPTISKIVLTMVTVCVSFFGQKYFSFRR